MMIRNFKTLGVAFAALLALSAVLASSASATFAAEKVPVTATAASNGIQTFTYQAEGTPVKCGKVDSTSTQSTTPSTDLTATTTYTECSTSFGPADVNMNGCTYTFTTHETTGITVHIVCPTGKKIEITVTDAFKNSICTLSIGAQTPAGAISFENLGAGTTREVNIKSANTGISSERSGSSLCGPLTSTTGTYSGEIRMTGEEDPGSGHIGIWVGE